MNAGERAKALAWISEDIADPDECRVLCNVRCLAESIDVPSLDAAIFMADKKSEIEVVQSVAQESISSKTCRGTARDFGAPESVDQENTPTPYYPYSGISLTDTFQLAEGIDPDKGRGTLLEEPINKLYRQSQKPIHVIIGNPPYSAGQKSANDNAQNLKYPLWTSGLRRRMSRQSKPQTRTRFTTPISGLSAGLRTSCMNMMRAA